MAPLGWNAEEALSRAWLALTEQHRDIRRGGEGTLSRLLEKLSRPRGRREMQPGTAPNTVLLGLAGQRSQQRGVTA